MKAKKKRVDVGIKGGVAGHYDRHGVLGEIAEGSVEFSLHEELREQILSGKRKRRLENISIKLEPAHIQALRKMGTMKSIPYQTLIRQILTKAIGEDLKITV